MTGPSRKRARRGLPHIANARNGVVRLAERVLEGRLAANLAVPRPSKAVGRSCPHAPCASNVEVAELGDVPAVHEVRAAAGAEAPVLVDEAPAVAALGDEPARMEADERDAGGQQRAFAVGQLARPRDALGLLQVRVARGEPLVAVFQRLVLPFRVVRDQTWVYWGPGLFGGARISLSYSNRRSAAKGRMVLL